MDANANALTTGLVKLFLDVGELRDERCPPLLELCQGSSQRSRVSFLQVQELVPGAHHRGLQGGLLAKLLRECLGGSFKM